MPQKCFMCGAAISQGILCEKCDKPRKSTRSSAPAQEPVAPSPAPAPAPAAAPAPPPVSRPAPMTTSAPVTVTAVALDAFPKAPVLPFPVESASPALTSVVSLLIAAAVPAVLLGADRSVKFVSDDA